MQKLKAFLVRRRLLLAGVLLAAVTALVLAWAGYDLSQRVDGEPVYQIVNDTYSQTLEIPADGGFVQAAPLRAGQTLYGVRIDLTNYNYAFATGQVVAEIIDENGELIVQGHIGCLEVRDNSFSTIIFPYPYTATQDETIRLHLYYVGTADKDAEQPMGIWVTPLSAA